METSHLPPPPSDPEQSRQEPGIPAPSASAVAEVNAQSVVANASKDASSGILAQEAPAFAPVATEPPRPNGVDVHDAMPPAPAAAADAPEASSVAAISALVNETNTTPRTEGMPEPSEPHLESADPIVQQPTSDLRTMAEPASAERATEIKEAKQHSDLAHDQELATGLAASTNAPIERTITPAPEEPAQPLAPASVPEEASEVKASELPHRTPSDAAIAEGVIEPTPTPAVAEPAAPTAQPTEAASAADKLALDDDYVMVDAPSPSKVPRPREEEDVEEPATKRIKPDASEEAVPADEPMADAPAQTEAAKPAPVTVELEKTSPSAETLPTPQAETANEPEVPKPKTEAPSTESAAASTDAAGKTQPAAYAPKTGNLEFDRPITAPQKKSLQKIISNIKRGQHAAAFKAPVDPVALNIPTYFDVVKEPMDLGTMEKKIKDNEYTNVNEFIKDFDQIIINCEKFNGLAHDITRHGHELGKSFEKQITQIPTSEFMEPPPPEKKAGARTPAEPRARRRESRVSIGGGAAGSPQPTASGARTAKSPTAGSPSSPAFALKEGGLPQIRRGSEVGSDGRPRREIHPPAPKELPYSTQKPRKKKYQAELKFCQKVLNDLKAPKYHASNWPFMQPVDPVALNLPTYRKVVKKPMDLSTIQNKMTKNEYEDAKEFEADVRLIFANCFKFNSAGEPVYGTGKSLENVFNDLWDEKKEWLKKNAPKSGGASPESGSEGSDAEDDDDAEDDEEEENTEKMKQLEQQIQQMSRSLEQMRKGSDAGKKKRTKSMSKTKEGKKKAKTEKKAAPKSKTKVHYVTYEQKQDISERINTLPPAQMNQALKVIRDNMPNLKGAQEDEIELDIDELPNEVLHKLLMFVRKYAPRAEDPIEPKSAPKPAASTKPKKNKPMGKVEQEARIRELKEKLAGGGGAGHSDDSPTQAAADDSSDDDDDDSEESEED